MTSQVSALATELFGGKDGSILFILLPQHMTSLGRYVAVPVSRVMDAGIEY